MKIWSVTGWQPNAPHWHAAFIEADTAEEAKEILAAWVEDESEEDTVWEGSVTPRDQWVVAEVKHPFRFILGAGCR